MIGKRVSHYRIIEKLGSGGMGDVYLAEDLELERRVALKILPAAFAAEPGRLQRFVREAKAASALNHPNVATIYEIREADGVHFIAMEYVAGKTLEDLDKPLDADGLIKIAVQIGDALEAAHSAGVIHRDIKPSNVMITSRGQAKLLDFGIAKRIAPARSLNISEMPTANPTIPGLIAGTVAYMSPEQVRGEAITTATDIFSLGIVLYELATGQHPFRAQSSVETLHAILSADPIHLAGLHSGVPPMLNEVVLRMLSKDPVLRPSAAELRIELMSGSPEAKLPPSRAAKPHTVGREKERMELRAGFESALSGKGLLLCVSGEPGIGKTTLVEDFIAELTAEGRCTVARGRSSERLAGTEAYLPWLEALESLLQSGTNPAVGQMMKQIAPTWYAQVVPLFGSDEGTARLTNEVRAASQERMKRELGAFLQEVSRPRPLVLFFRSALGGRLDD